MSTQRAARSAARLLSREGLWAGMYATGQPSRLAARLLSREGLRARMQSTRQAARITSRQLAREGLPASAVPAVRSQSSMAVAAHGFDDYEFEPFTQVIFAACSRVPRTLWRRCACALKLPRGAPGPHVHEQYHAI